MGAVPTGGPGQPGPSGWWLQGELSWIEPAWGYGMCSTDRKRTSRQTCRWPARDRAACGWAPGDPPLGCWPGRSPGCWARNPVSRGRAGLEVAQDPPRDPTRVGRWPGMPPYWPGLTRREKRNPAPGLRRPPAELTRPMGTGRGAAAALAALSVGLRVAAAEPGPDFRTRLRQVDPGAPELTRAASHSSIALSTPRPPRSSASRGRGGPSHCRKSRGTRGGQPPQEIPL